MKVNVGIVFPSKISKKIVELKDECTALELIKKLALKPDITIIVRNNIPIPIDEKLRNGDKIRLISVVSGG